MRIVDFLFNICFAPAKINMEPFFESIIIELIGVLRCFILVIIALLFGSCKKQLKTEHIVVADIANANREFIAKEIAVLSALKPKVIAIDVRFIGLKEAYEDSVLAVALRNVQNLVMITTLGDYRDGRIDEQTGVSDSMPLLISNAIQGYGDAILEDDEYHTLKRFSVSQNINGTLRYHFAVQAALKYDSLRTKAFLNCNEEIASIDYVGNVETFKVLSIGDILEHKISADEVTGKIVLIGSLNPFDNDKFYTPLRRAIDPEAPDMFGVMVLANIIVQITSFKECR